MTAPTHPAEAPDPSLNHDELRSEVAQAITQLRAASPLVHAFAALPSMPLIANGLLAAGARPLMTETEGEAPALVRHADALVVGLGTLGSDAQRGIPVTIAAAREAGVPWTLDPTAVGLAPVRTALARQIVQQGPAVVRGNASEVRMLADPDDASAGGSGPDSTVGTSSAASAAGRLQREHGCAVAVSGEVDLVLGPGGRVELANGTPMLARVSGTGCFLGALVAACTAVTTPFVASLAATAHLTVAAEVAAGTSRGPGTFVPALLDALDAVSAEQVATAMVLR